jgi:starch synthase
VGWAVSTYYDRRQHIQKMIQAAMRQDYSWQKSAEAYGQLYERAMAVKAG